PRKGSRSRRRRRATRAVGAQSSRTAMAGDIILGYRGRMTRPRSAGKRRAGALAWAAAAAALALAPAAAHAQEPPDDRVPIQANFSPAERVTIVFVGLTGVIALAVAPVWYTPDAPSFGAPAPGSCDRRISESLYQANGRDERFLWGAPDVGGLFVLPYLPAFYYGAELTWEARTGHPLLGDVDAEHHLWAYAEALGWTA